MITPNVALNWFTRKTRAVVAGALREMASSRITYAQSSLFKTERSTELKDSTNEEDFDFAFDPMASSASGDVALSAAEKLSSRHFYGEYHGHRVEDLRIIYNALRGVDGRRPLIWLAGDSSLDNKHWLLGSRRVPAVRGLAGVLDPPVSVPDVAHQLASECIRRGLPFGGVMNCAVEESTMGEREAGRALLPQDEFLCDHIRVSP